MRISDGSSDVCSSDLGRGRGRGILPQQILRARAAAYQRRRAEDAGGQQGMPGHGKLFPQRARCVQAGIAYRTAARGSQSTLRALPRNRGSIRKSTRLAHANYFPEDLMQIQFSAARPDADFVVLPVEKDRTAAHTYELQ